MLFWLKLKDQYIYISFSRNHIFFLDFNQCALFCDGFWLNRTKLSRKNWFQLQSRFLTSWTLRSGSLFFWIKLWWHHMQPHTIPHLYLINVSHQSLYIDNNIIFKEVKHFCESQQKVLSVVQSKTRPDLWHFTMRWQNYARLPVMLIIPEDGSVCKTFWKIGLPRLITLFTNLRIFQAASLFHPSHLFGTLSAAN